jgi:hypothetical protein
MHHTVQCETDISNMKETLTKIQKRIKDSEVSL